MPRSSRLADERVQVAATAARFAQRHEHAMRREHTVVDDLEVVVAHGVPLLPHDADQVVDQPALGDERVGERIDRRQHGAKNRKVVFDLLIYRHYSLAGADAEAGDVRIAVGAADAG